MKKIVIILAVFLISQIKNLEAQSSGSYGFSDAKSMSMGLTYASNGLGIDAIGVNPANLALDDLSSFSLKTFFPLPPINLSITTPLSIEKYNYFFGGVDDGTGKIVGRYLTQSDKDELNQLLGESDLIFNMNLNYLSFAFMVNEKIGGFGFAFVDRFGTNIRLSKVFTDLIFSGLYPVKIYSLSDMNVQAQFWRELSFSYGRKVIELDNSFVKNLYAGISIKFIRGYYYLNTLKNNSYFQLGDDNVIRGNWDYEIQHAFTTDIAKNYGKDSIISVEDYSFSPFPTPAGTGTGFDIGFTSYINDQFKVAFAVTDIGSINWDQNHAIIKGSGEFTFEGYSSKDQIDSLTDKFKQVTSDLESSFSSSLPTALRFGISYQLDKAPFISNFPGTMLVAFDYNQGLNNAIGNTTKPRFSLGIDWKPAKFIPRIRTGISLGGKLGFRLGFGLGFALGPINFDLATYNFESIVSPNSARKINFALESRWRF